MSVKIALLAALIYSSATLFAFDRNKSAKELENVELTVPGRSEKRSYDINKNTPYAVSALVSASHRDIAWFEVRLFAGNEQCDFIRSIRASKESERLEVVFDSGRADRAEVLFILIPDAMPGSRAVFKEYRFVSCSNVTVREWQKGNYRCPRRKFTQAGDVIIYPGGGRSESTGSVQLLQIIPNKKMRFSAEVKCEFANAARLAVNCGGKNIRSKSFRSSRNRKKNETLYVDFDTQNFTWITLELSCTNGRKFRNNPVTFSNMKLVPLTGKQDFNRN